MEHVHPSYRIDFRKLMADLGGINACRRRLEQMGIEVAHSTLNRAAGRGELQSIYLANLMAHQVLFGPGPVDLNRYVIRQEDPEKARRSIQVRPGRARAPAAPAA